MKKEDIIVNKIEFLNGFLAEDIDEEMHAVVADDESLEKELDFIQSVWSDNSLEYNKEPSNASLARFHQLLGQTVASGRDEQSSSTPGSELSAKFSEFIESIFKPAAFAHMLLLSSVFFVGWFSSQNSTQSDLRPVANLERQVSSLNSLVALSMLQNQSAAERITGVTYAKASLLENDKVNQALFRLLNNDRSSAVRLAVVEALAENYKEEKFQSLIMSSLPEQQNSLVQLALVQLILNEKNITTKRQLDELIKNESLNNEVIQLFNQRNNTIQTI